MGDGLWNRQQQQQQQQHQLGPSGGVHKRPRSDYGSRVSRQRIPVQLSDDSAWGKTLFSVFAKTCVKMETTTKSFRFPITLQGT
ncbi:hypothetical protein EV1_002431 [Malus domestica]